MSHEQRLNEIRRRADKATAGPWFLMLDGFSRKPPHNSPTVYAADSELRYIAWFRDLPCATPTPNAANAEFVAHARSDIPYLLDRVAELERLVAEAQARGEDDATQTFSPEITQPTKVTHRLTYDDRVRLAARHQPPQRWHDEDVTGLDGGAK